MKGKDIYLICVVRQWMVSHVWSDNEACEVFISNGIDGVTDNAQDVETGQDGLSQVNVVGESHAENNKLEMFNFFIG